MPEAVIFIGTQASGKSTFYRERFFRTHVRINRDMLRTRNREKRLFEFCLETEMSFVVDNTNPTREDRSKFLEALSFLGQYSVKGFYFRSEINLCLSRNMSRPEEERIPDLGIRGTHAKLEFPQFNEGFDSLWYVKILESGQFSVEPWADEI